MFGQYANGPTDPDPRFDATRCNAICGWYQPRAQLADMQAWSMVGAGAEVVVRRGQLMLRVLSAIPALYRGLLLHPYDEKDPHVFRIDRSEFGIGTGRVVFSREPGVEATSIHLDLVPLSLQKRPNIRDPRAWVNGVLAASATALAIRHVRARPPACY